MNEKSRKHPTKRDEAKRGIREKGKQRIDEDTHHRNAANTA